MAGNERTSRGAASRGILRGSQRETRRYRQIRLERLESGFHNARFQTGAAAGLSVDQVRGLKLRWAFGFDGDVTAFAAPTVIDGQVFVGSAAGLIHALRADSGCLQWVFQANGPVRSAIVEVPLGGQHALLFGDMTGWFYAVGPKQVLCSGKSRSKPTTPQG